MDNDNQELSLQELALALYEQYGVYTVFLDQAPELKDISPLTGEAFNRATMGIARQNMKRWQVRGRQTQLENKQEVLPRESGADREKRLAEKRNKSHDTAFFDPARALDEQNKASAPKPVEDKVAQGLPPSEQAKVQKATKIETGPSKPEETPDFPATLEEGEDAASTSLISKTSS